MRRIFTAALVASATVIFTATPALAHGSSGPDATNFVSTINRVEGTDDDILAEVSWSVLGNDAMVRVDNRADQELAVEGYSGEPYLRIGPSGVWENKNSPAVYLNSDRFASVEVPDGVSAEAKPNWVRVSDESSYYWHDHRMHWMSAELPPQVATSDEDVIEVQDWSIPFSVGAESFAVNGTLRWIRPEPVWPWLVGALVVVCLPMITALRQPNGPKRRVAASRTLAGVIAAVAALNIVHSIDDIRALPATLGENVAAGLQSAFFIGVSFAGLYLVRRRSNSTWIGVLIAAIGIGLGIGLPHLQVLSSSQLVTSLPEWFSRSLLSASVAILVPAAVVGWRGYSGDVTAPVKEPKQPTDRQRSAKGAHSTNPNESRGGGTEL